MARKTGLSESKISRLAKVASPELSWLYSGVQTGIIGLGSAGKLVDACGDNREKLTALRTTFEGRIAKAEEERRYWINHMASRNRKWDRKTREKAKLATYFKSTDWSAWLEAIEADDGIVETDGVISLNVDPSKVSKKSGVRIGDASDWRHEFAVYGLFEQRLDDVEPDDIDYVLAHWDNLRDILEAIRDGKPIPSINPVTDIHAPQPPTEQSAEMRVVGEEPTDE